MLNEVLTRILDIVPHEAEFGEAALRPAKLPVDRTMHNHAFAGIVLDVPSGLMGRESEVETHATILRSGDTKHRVVEVELNPRLIPSWACVAIGGNVNKRSFDDAVQECDSAIARVADRNKAVRMGPRDVA